MAEASYKSAFAREEQKNVRRDILIAEATRLFNDKGYAGTTLDDLANNLSLTKTALYYYVRDKEDLLYNCYLHTCDLIEASIDQAAREGSNGLERICRWILHQLSDENGPYAMQSELPLLSPPHRQKVIARTRQNLRSTQKFIEEGIADGSIRPLPPRIVNWAISGALAWTPYWRFDVGTYPLGGVAAAFTDVFVNGLSVDRKMPAFAPGPALLLQQPGPVTTFDREQRTRAKRDALLRASSHLFNQQGADGTTLDEIVDGLGVTKGAFYHYFNSKEELLYDCYLRSIGLDEAIWRWAQNNASSKAGTLVNALRGHVIVHCGDQGPLALFTNVHTLSQGHAKTIVAHGRRMVRRATHLISRAIKEGSLRETDPLLAQYALTGAINWLPKWYRPDGQLSGEEIADAFAQLFLLGLKA